MGRAELALAGLGRGVLPRFTLRTLAVELGDISTGVAFEFSIATVLAAAAGHAI